MTKLGRQIGNLAVSFGVIQVNAWARLSLFAVDNRVEHYMAPEELERLLTVLRAHRNRPVCNAALFLLSTGARLNEALSATWEHIDRANRVWRIPASNSKSKKVRSVPLNDSALEVLDQLGTEGKSPHLFVSRKTGERLVFVHKSWSRVRDLSGLRTCAFTTCAINTPASWSTVGARSMKCRRSSAFQPLRDGALCPSELEVADGRRQHRLGDDQGRVGGGDDGSGDDGGVAVVVRVGSAR